MDLNCHNLINKMTILMKNKSHNLIRHSKDPIHPILKIIRTGHYNVVSMCIYEKNRVDVAQLKSLWEIKVCPEDIMVQDVLNDMFQRDAYTGDPEMTDSAYENGEVEHENLTDLCTSGGASYLSLLGDDPSRPNTFKQDTYNFVFQWWCWSSVKRAVTHNEDKECVFVGQCQTLNFMSMKFVIYVIECI